MAEALKDHNRLIKWVTSSRVWNDAQREKVKKEERGKSWERVGNSFS